MPDWEHDEARIEAASQAVLKIPGVHSVYLGPRYRNGRKTGEMALCVLVRTKRPLEEVAPRDLVPPEVAGIPTDVIESDPPRPLQRLDSDDKYAQPSLADLPMFDDEEYTRLRGGIACEGGGGTGTLGCIARATDTANNGKFVLLSNWHVLTSKGNGEGKTVRQPRESCCCCGRKVGVVLRTRKTNTGAFYLRHPDTPNLDAGIALLNPGVEALAEIQQAAGSAGGTDLVRGVRADASITANLAVQKRGSRTGPTQGTIDSRFGIYAPEGNSDKATAFRRQLVIDPGFPPGTTTGVFRFGAGGDSGSVVMTQAGGEVVGLLWAVTATRPLAPANRDLVVVKGIASNIHEVISELQIDIATATTAGQILTNPAPAPAPAPATPLSEGSVPQPVRATMLNQARLQIEQTQYGRQYIELVRRHHSEVSRLVRTNRRVGAIWARYGGTAFVQAILDAVALPDEPIPSTIASRPVAESTARIGMMLKRYGSAALARDIDNYERVLPGLCGRSYNELLARLRAGEPVLG